MEEALKAFRSQFEKEAEPYRNALRSRLVASHPLKEDELRQLAIARAKAVRDQLADKGAISDARIFVLEPEPVGESGDTVIRSQLNVTGG